MAREIAVARAAFQAAVSVVVEGPVARKPELPSEGTMDA
jgi:hypothetical protein